MELIANGKKEDKWMKSNKILKASFWYTFSNFLLKGISFITVPIFTRIMSEAELGQFSALTTWISLLSPIVTVSLYNSVILAKYDFKNEYNKYLSSISILGLITTSIVYLVAFMGMGFTVKATRLPLYAVHIMFLYMIALPGVELLQSKLRADLKYIPVVIITVVTTVISVGAALIFVLSSTDRFRARTIGTYIPLIIIYSVLLLYLIIKGRSFSWKYNKYALTLCIPLVIHGLAGNLMHSSDRLMIQQLCNDESVALYSVAYSVGMLINIVRNSVESAWDPWLFEKLSCDDRHIIRKYSYPYVMAFAIMCMGIVMLAPEIMMILGGGKYRIACYVIPPVVISYFVSMIYSLYSGLERYYKQQKWFALFAFIAAGCNIMLNVIFIPKFGYIAAAYTTLASSIVECLLHFFNAKRLGYTNAYDNKFNLLIVCACIGVSIVITMLYDRIFYRLIFFIFAVLLLAVVMIKKKDSIKKAVRRFLV